MSRAAVIGEGVRVQGYALAGALVRAVEDQDEAIAAWRSLPPDIAVVVVTGRVAAWLGETPQPARDALLVVMPG